MPIKEHKILIIGFGTVGQGFFDLFHKKRKELGLENVEIIEIVDKFHGYIDNPSPSIIQELKSGKKFPERDVVEVIRNSDADIVCEFTWVNLETAEPAYTYMKTALESGKHVLTTNKGPIALKLTELNRIAEMNGVNLRFKGTVMAGTPSFNILSLLPGVKVKRIRGIMNGTTNFILSEMASGISFEIALKKAQELGYAESDPTNDVDGFDSAAKAVILSNLMGWSHTMKSIEREGIRNVSPEEAMNQTKLLVFIDESQAYVKPVKLPENDILSSVDGVMNAIEFETDTLGKIYSMGPGAGKVETAQAALTDLVDILK